MKKPLPFENFGRKERKKFTAQSSAYVIICETEANGFKGEEDGKTAGDCERWENNAQTAGDAEGGKITPERTSLPLFRYFPKRKRFPRKIVGYAPANHCFFFDFLLYC